MTSLPSIAVRGGRVLRAASISGVCSRKLFGIKPTSVDGSSVRGGRCNLIMSRSNCATNRASLSNAPLSSMSTRSIDPRFVLVFAMKRHASSAMSSSDPGKRSAIMSCNRASDSAVTGLAMSVRTISWTRTGPSLEDTNVAVSLISAA